MNAIDLHVLIPHVRKEDISFLYKFLQLDPLNRVSAEDALQDDYFKRIPHPYMPSELPVPPTNINQGKSENSSMSLEQIQFFIRDSLQ